ncbi:hypothetical protein PI95_028650 [Hassallia byssoidea VB512170]|uniref:Uncharacterized protein n=1 Tax=Hassallia byssoidea VB512170 TaxID=1304833 RepID=A0A846HGB6_9CYAN|nr:hypothetical protein [Hassalia byssoidea]NEU76375.1 hypothetical protein [Hassalia byssoidea VB512170]
MGNGEMGGTCVPTKWGWGEGGTISFYYLLPITYAQCPMPIAQCPMPNAQSLADSAKRSVR